MFTHLSRAFAASAVVLLGMFVIRYVTTDRPPPPPDVATEQLVIDRPDRDLGEVEAGLHDIEFSVTNTGSDPRRIVGNVGEGCVPNCCFAPIDAAGTATIGPGETFVCRYRLDVKGTGRFDAPISLHLDDNGLRTVKLHVRGTGVPRKQRVIQ